MMNNSFYNDFEVSFFKYLKETMLPYKNTKNSMMYLLRDPRTGEYTILKILDDGIDVALKSNDMYKDSDTEIKKVHIETAIKWDEDSYIETREIVESTEFTSYNLASKDFRVSYKVGNDVIYSNDVIDISNPNDLRYKKYTLVDKFVNEDIIIVTFLFSNGYYLGFNMKRKINGWQDMTTNDIL